MNERLNAEVILCRCGQNKSVFGIRVEEKRHRVWEMNWAFALSEKRARGERYGENKVQGSFEFGDDYPGCPYCGNTGIFTCGGCKEVTCWDGSKKVTCAHCNRTIEIGGRISELKTGGDV